MLESNQQVQTRNILNGMQFNCVRKIGKGGFGHVLLATKATSSSTFYAIKCLSKKKMIKDPLLKKSLIQQINTMASLDHPNIVKLYKTFEEGDWYFLVLEYCDMGNLYSIQSKMGNKVFPYEEAVSIFNQILRGVECIHKNKIIHRDLKLQNIFLKKTDKNSAHVCKIGDFGLARFVEGTANSNCGTQNYMAPEILQSIPYQQQVDIWSLGVLFYYLLFGEFPFKGINILDQIYSKCKFGFRLTDLVKKNYLLNKKEEAILSDFFQKIFRVDPSQRINIKQVREHPAIRLRNLEVEESTTEEDASNESAIEWQINQIKFLQKIVKSVEIQGFLSSYLLCAFKFYINKVILYFLNKQSIRNYRKDKQGHPRLLKLLAEIEVDVTKRLQKLLYLLKNNSDPKENIQKFEEGLNTKYQDFTNFKMGYRNTIGRVYEEVHRKFGESTYERASLKLKVFLCHIINRVFSGNLNHGLFPFYVAWLKKDKLNKNLKSYDFRLLDQWIEKETIQNLNSSQEIINKTFYK